MATPSTPAKINVYKLVGSPKVPTDAMKKAGPLGQGIIQGQKAQLTALNRIGTTLNSIQGSLKGIPVYMSVCLSLCLSVCLSVSMSVCLSTNLSFCVTAILSILLFCL